MEDNQKIQDQKITDEEVKNDDEKNDDEKTQKKPEGSGIFTVDGKELPKVEGGYTFYHGGGSIGENDLK